MTHRLLDLSLLLLGLLVIPMSHLAISSPPKKADAAIPTAGTALYHAYQCAKELGPLPAFSCSDASEIPITQNGKPVHGEVDGCDKPAALGNLCQVGNRVGRYESTYDNGDPRPEVTFRTFCRDGGWA